MKQESKSKEETQKFIQSFQTTVLEVHSGDSFTATVPKSSPQRFFLSSYRAPNGPRHNDLGKPFGFESKEKLRRTLIGKKFTLHHEYTRQVQEKDMQFASLMSGETNVVFSLLEGGFGQIAFGKEQSFQIQEMKNYEKIAQEKKIGIWKENQSLQRLVDNCNDKKAKQFWSFVNKDKQMDAVVEAVINGAKLKIRLTQGQELIMFQLNGVRVCQNDPNVEVHKKYSESALRFSKLNILQRDVTVQLDDCDKNGTFLGTLWLQKKNYALTLLDQGLAFCNNQGRTSSPYSNEYRNMENQAKEAKKGLWSEQEQTQKQNDSTVTDSDQVQNLTCTEVLSAQYFYLQNHKSSQLSTINQRLQKFDENKEPNLEFPAKKGTPCVAKFDGGWYRARISGAQKSETCQVFFCDFGNTDEVYLDEIKKMPKDLLNIPDQALKCTLAYLTTPSPNHEMGDAVYDLLAELIMEKELQTNVVFQVKDIHHVLVKLKDQQKYVNEQLLVKGNAKIYQQKKLPSQFQSWVAIQDKAMDKKQGMWKFDDEDDGQQ